MLIDENKSVYDQFQKDREIIGTDTFIDELYSYLSMDERKDFLENLERNWDIDSEE